MPHGFRTEVDREDLLRFRKEHNNGEETVVDVTKDIPGEDYEVTVTDPRGNRNLGRFDTKAKARNRAKQFMRENPKGVAGQDQGVPGFSGGHGGIPGTDGNGLF